MSERIDCPEEYIAVLVDLDGVADENVWNALFQLCRYLYVLGHLNLSETLCRQLLSSIESKRGREDELYLRAQIGLLFLLAKRRKWGQLQVALSRVKLQSTIQDFANCVGPPDIIFGDLSPATLASVAPEEAESPSSCR